MRTAQSIYDKIDELEKSNVFDKPIIGCHKTTYRDGLDLIHPPILKIGRNRLGSLFGLTWRQGLKIYHNRHSVRPIEIETSTNCLSINFFDGESIVLDDVTRLSQIVALEDQLILGILDKCRNLYILYSVFFDNPSSGLIIDPTKLDIIL